MAEGAQDLGMNSAHADYVARSLAQEAVSMHRHHDSMDQLQFKNMTDKIENVINMITATNSKIDNMAKSYDNKFWTLAVTIIFSLLSALGFLCYHLVLNGQHNG